MLRNAFLVASALALCAGPLAAQEFKVGNLVIEHPFARATPPGAAVAGVYLKVSNAGKESDRLVRVGTPVAGTAEVHEMYFESNVMKMRAVAGIEVKPGATLTLQPGSYHVMLSGLKGPLAEGDRFPLTLSFDKAGSVQVDVEVEAITATPHNHKH
jgi:copper(I)-binding protein